MATLMLVNPRKRRKKKHHLKRNPFFGFGRRKRRRHRGAKRHHRKFRRNPLFNLRGRAGGTTTFRNVIPSVIKPAAMAAVGAVSLDLIWGYLPLPVNIRTGAARHIAKGAGAVLLGVAGSKLLGSDIGHKFAAGAMTVVIYGMLRDLAARTMPGLRLGDMGDNFLMGDVIGQGYPELGYVSVAKNAGMGIYDGEDMNALYDPRRPVTAMVPQPHPDSGVGIYDYS